LQEVPLAQIDLAETAVEMAAAPALGGLAASLQEVGLINPPWLRPQPGGPRFGVVTGTRRLKVAADLGWQEITVRLVPEGTPDFYCLLVHVIDNAFTRGFNLREQAALAARLLRHCDPETVAARYLPYLACFPGHLSASSKRPVWPAWRSWRPGRLAYRRRPAG
jgi:ParB-like chromosome segregation protein Spo0J